jgi:hydrogenase nickel incorporation protein HypA/HybF
MHEMPVTQAILNMALNNAGGARVTDIYLQVGRMAAVVPSSIEIFFDHLSRGTAAENARLHFEIMPLEMTCMVCGRPADLSAWTQERPHVMMARAIAQGCECGSKQLRVTGGVSFGMSHIETEESGSGIARETHESTQGGRT